MAAEPDPADAAAPPRCAHCGDAIGVYEPLVYLDAQRGPVRTSLLRMSDAVPHDAPVFHAACRPAT